MILYSKNEKEEKEHPSDKENLTYGLVENFNIEADESHVKND